MRRRTLLWIGFLIVAALLMGAAFVGGRSLFQALKERRLEEMTYAPAPAGMVLVPAGDFIMGSDAPQADHLEHPARSVFVPAFYIDTYEVTNAAYAAFDPTHTYPEGHATYPVTGVGKDDAEAYAASLGKRLPTNIEWEKAARGTDGRAYPWGDAFIAANANLGGGNSLAPVGSHPDGVSPYGVHDMAGNAWEWVSDVYRDDEALGVKHVERGIIRGGAFSYSAFQGRTSYIGFESVGLTCNDLGFRCAKDAQTPSP